MDRKLEEASSKLAWLKLACADDERACTVGELASCAALLTELKVLLTKFPSMPPSFERTPNAVAELKLARSIYEFAVIFSIKVKDQDAFERNFFQLKVFYMDTRGILPPSPEEYRNLGLNLMRLLAENRVAEFHTELELLPPRALDHPCIKYVVELEQSFMEGTYNRVINGQQAVPHETYLYFKDLLAETIRDEIADCSGQAYDHLPVNDVRDMLMFSSEQQLLEYISEAQHEWEVQNHSVLFHMAKVQPRVGIQAHQMIKRSLCYARELGRIV
ncbi:26S proteasome non-ATPase regulatory subunit 8 homolog A-like [Hordeum vulgare subsp. vulgare]|uniref:PCI domain-containing protein n=1 Tax=Hordeum vulgare subsp. vulgare TaxID=112509 RepID=A0A8I6WHK2_HORVV|nr:26S proteasome non-ATPase regulatory subunit 8 homolog A-like [Hordeum vulgare subsp. vulgare]